MKDNLVAWIQSHRALVIILSLAFALHIAAMLFFGESLISFDARDFHRLGENLAAGHGFSIDGMTPFLGVRPPVYAYVVGATYWLVGAKPAAVFVLQGLLRLLVIGLVYSIVKTRWNHEAALVSAFLLAIYPLHAYYGNTLLTETLAMTLLVAWAYVYPKLRETGQGMAWTGALLGLLVLTRPVFVLFPLLLAGYEWIQTRDKQTLGRVLLLLLVFALVMTPWTVRNYTQFGEPVYASLGASLSFAQGNPELLDPNAPVELGPEFGIATDATESLDPVRAIAQEKEAMRVFRNAALANPGTYSKNVMKRIGFLWLFPSGVFQIPAFITEGRAGADTVGFTSLHSVFQGNLGAEWTRLRSNPMQLGAFLSYEILWLGFLFVSLLGLWKYRKDPGARAWILMLVYATLIQSLFIANPRYHEPLMPFLIIGFSVFLVDRFWNVEHKE